MTYVRSLRVTINLDTNKYEIERTYTPGEGEGLADMLRRLADEIESVDADGGIPWLPEE